MAAPRHIRSRALALAALLALASIVASPAPAEDLEALYKEADQQLRAAQRDMFGGKKDEAVAALPAIRDLIMKIKAAAPDEPRTKTTESNYTKLVKDLERRTGRDLGGGTLTAAASSTPTELPPRPEQAPPPTGMGGAAPQAPVATSATAAKLPYDARRPADQARQSLRSVDDYIKKLQDPDYPGDKEQVLSNIDGRMARAREMLQTSRDLAAKKGVTSHPEFDEIASGLVSAQKRIAAAREDYEASSAQAAAAQGEVNADVAALRALYDEVRPVFDKATGYAIHYNDLATAEDLLQTIEAFEKEDQARVRQALESFASTYGSTGEEIDAKAESMGYSGQGRASYPYTALAEGVKNVAKTRAVMAQDILERARQMLENSRSGIHDFYRIENLQNVRLWTNASARFDPDNDTIREFLAGLEAKIDADMEDLEAKIDEATWPRHASDAPGDTKKLAATALAFLQKQEDAQIPKRGEKSRVLAVSVTGPWRVFKRNILDEPIQYGLPVVCAVQADSEKPLDLARVYELTLLTAEAAGVEKAPPFIGAAVGDSHYIRPEKVE